MQPPSESVQLQMTCYQDGSRACGTVKRKLRKAEEWRLWCEAKEIPFRLPSRWLLATYLNLQASTGKTALQTSVAGVRWLQKVTSSAIPLGDCLVAAQIKSFPQGLAKERPKAAKLPEVEDIENLEKMNLDGPTPQLRV